jgi:carbonic anhydrase
MKDTVVELLAGNARHASEYHDRFDDVRAGQRPAAVTVCCADSRVLGDHIWGNDEPGSIFTCANIGNRAIQRTDAGEVVSGDVLYPIRHTGTEVAVVVGHTGCGAVTAAYDRLTDGGGDPEPDGIRHCLDLLTPHLADSVETLDAELSRTATVTRLVERNVDRQVAALVGSDDVPPAVTCVGVVYDFHDVYSGQCGEVHVVNVDGVTDPAELRAAHPEIESRIERRGAPS